MHQFIHWLSFHLLVGCDFGKRLGILISTCIVYVIQVRLVQFIFDDRVKPRTIDRLAVHLIKTRMQSSQFEIWLGAPRHVLRQ